MTDDELLAFSEIMMRQDLYKVMVERPRRGKSGCERATRRRDDHDGPVRLGMRAGYGERELNENLAPLRRYLLSQVGRPWDKVFSEICTNIDRRNTVQQHIHQHIEDFIATRVEMSGEELRDLRSTDRFSTRKDLSQPLFVDPRTGLIRVNKKYREWRRSYAQRRQREQAEVDARCRVLDERTLLLRLNDVWFEVNLAELPVHREVPTTETPRGTKRIAEPRYDVVLRRWTSRADANSHERHSPYDVRDVYAVSKRQLSTREIKVHELRE